MVSGWNSFSSCVERELLGNEEQMYFDLMVSAAGVACVPSGKMSGMFWPGSVYRRAN